MFGEGQPQPPGRSIISLKSWANGPIPEPVRHYDWTRIVALLIDEPYNSVTSSPCVDGAAQLAAANIDQLLAARAAELQSFAPFTRFWVNFADTQVAWMMDSTCFDFYPPDSAFLVKPYMDVISVDSYYSPFTNPNNGNDYVQKYYDFLVPRRATPYQQIALIPGTFYRNGRDNQNNQASFIPAFFDYANNANQTCNLPLPSRGVTGSFDGCLVWMVLGFAADTFNQNGNEYVCELDPRATVIRQVWEAEVALPERRDSSIELTRQQIVSTLMTQWLND